MPSKTGNGYCSYDGFDLIMAARTAGIDRN